MIFPTSHITEAQLAAYLPCADLTSADCELLITAVDRTLSASSATLVFETQVLLSSSSEAVLSAAGEASYVLNGFGDFISQLSFERSVFNPRARAQMAEVADLFLSDLRRLNAALNLTVSVSPALGLNIPQTITLDAQLINGTGYISLDTLAILFNNPTLSGTGGLDLVSLSRALLANEPRLIEEMALPHYFYLNTNIFVQNPADAAFLNPYVEMERLPDEGTNAVFEMMLDLESLLADAEFRAWVDRRAEMYHPFFTEARVNQALFLLSILAQDSDLVMQARVDLDSEQLVLLNGALQIQTEDAVVQPPISLEFTFQWRELNRTEPVLPPANARILPYQMLVQQAG